MPLLDAATLAHEIDRASEAFEKVLGQRPRYFRPPWGFYNRRVLDELRRRGFLTVLWTRSSQDWRNPGPETIERLAAGDPKMGDILLFHDGGNYPAETMPTCSRADTVEGLERVIVRLERFGFELKNLDDMVAGWVS
jgi:peptidoglycan/xylan/chitin deacetylase (PgdA/CDA1 family)